MRALKIIRKQRGLTLEALATLSGLGKSTIGNYENGLTDMAEESLKTLAECLAVTPTDLSAQYPQKTVHLSQSVKTDGDGFSQSSSRFPNLYDSPETQEVMNREEILLSDIRVRIIQFKFASSSMRKIWKSEIIEKLDEYAVFCEKNCETIRQTLLKEARKRNL
jgi:transcriptional regulator with XRE-family HTH domain